MTKSIDRRSGAIRDCDCFSPDKPIRSVPMRVGHWREMILAGLSVAWTLMVIDYLYHFIKD